MKDGVLVMGICFLVCVNVAALVQDVTDQLQQHSNLPADKTMVMFTKEDESNILLLVDKTKFVTFYFKGTASVPKVTFSFILSHSNVIGTIRNKSVDDINFYTNFSVKIVSRNPGKTNVGVVSSNPAICTSKAYLNVNIFRTNKLKFLSDVTGWIYFFAWSVSFYPQIYDNFRRKCVVGLNFDFLCLNVVGFFLYSLYNVGLFYVAVVQDTYMTRHQTVVLPVKENDVVFGLHAMFACVITIFQCCIYDRGTQKVSGTCKLLVTLMALFMVGILISAFANVIVWLDFLTYASYVKLFITTVKYIPQAYMNFVRRSTSGWSIGNVILDFTGGFFSICQMLIDSYNFSDWTSFTGDPTKFGLGLFSIAFDILFMLQHYVCYKQREYQPLAVMEGFRNHSREDDEERVGIVEPEQPVPSSYRSIQ